jgi:carboxyl-terminal processing protease
VEEDMSGGFEGIGIEFLMVDDTMHVITPISGGPAEAAGMLAGDKVVSINDTTIAGVRIDNGTIFRKLRGQKGTSVKVGILRGKENTQRYFNLIRAVIPVQSVDVAYMLDDKTGYIRVNRFTERTNQEFMEGLTNLAENKGLQHLVLDLRGNPGGYSRKPPIFSVRYFLRENCLFTHREDRKTSGSTRVTDAPALIFSRWLFLLTRALPLPVKSLPEQFRTGTAAG